MKSDQNRDDAQRNCPVWCFIFWPGDHREEQEGPLEEPEFGPQLGIQALYGIKGGWWFPVEGQYFSLMFPCEMPISSWVVSNISYFSIYWESNYWEESSQLTFICFKMLKTTN